MQIQSAIRRNRHATYRFLTTSVVAENHLPYATKRHEMQTPEVAMDFWQTVIATQPDHEPDKENLVVVLLNTHLRPYAWNRVSVGNLNQTIATPREIMRPVIAGAAFAFIMMHNHPSGDPTPSSADESITRRIAECSQLFQIRFTDHVIIGTATPGRSAYHSFLEGGIL